MPRGRRKNSEKENYECCGGRKGGKIFACGLALIALGLLIKVGWSISDILLLAGAVFLVKGLLFSAFRK